MKLLEKYNDLGDVVLLGVLQKGLSTCKNHKTKLKRFCTSRYSMLSSRY